MGNWKVELPAGGKPLAVMKINGGIIQRVAFSVLLFMIANMLHNHTIRKCTMRDNMKLFEKRKRKIFGEFNSAN